MTRISDRAFVGPLAVMLLVTASVPGKADDVPQFTSCHEAGASYKDLSFREKRAQGELFLDQVMQLCKAAVATDPADKRALYYYGLANSARSDNGGGYILRAMRLGDVEALMHVSNQLWDEQDPESEAARKALDLMSQAAKSGNSKARVSLAVMLIRGQGTAKDLSKAFTILGEEAQRGNGSAHFFLATSLDKTDRPSPMGLSKMQHLRVGSDLGFAPAKAMLGFFLAEESDSSEGRKEGERLMAEAAATGDFTAMLNLAHYYISTGDGFVGPDGRDVRQGIFWFCEIGEKGERIMQEYLGETYKCPKSYWLNK